ncbi:plasmid replication protein RepC [Pelagibacterium sp. H642]|uniref:plasmid replication protein RepC n=1 Tax=Pelagibacterium sp. H642 TaxID=1881069 RepID=UPI0028158C19|nr:plasmid replication protein RepC [Pelagibacterium sp. H642]WMT92531.1 plasmid replication protein RepC [Pelagibacterium sp. H642]
MSVVASGLRRTTPGRLAAVEYARDYRKPGAKRITRTAALQAAKRGASAMGLKTAKLALIDQLFAYTKAKDWTDEGVVPVVWPSNAVLARRLGVSVSTMKHHLNGLVEAGLVAYQDGPTYQRHGRRDENDRIIEAAGIDLSPIAVRFTELTELADAAEYAARQWKRFSDRRTILRKEVQSLIQSAIEEGFPGPWGRAMARLDVLREARAADLDQLMEWVDELEGMQEELEEAYNKAIHSRNMDTAVSKFRPIQTTAQTLNPESSNQNRTWANAHDSNLQTASGGAFERKPGEGAMESQILTAANDVLDEDVQSISLPLVREACPKVVQLAPYAFESWTALRDSGTDISHRAGINPQVWQEARQHLGPDIAIAALAVTVQKAELGLVQKPGAYMRRLCQLGQQGELRISRSLFGLAKAGLAGAAAVQPSFEPNSIAPKAKIGFPEGNVSWTRWAEVIRENAPKPTPDIEMVASRFRNWARDNDIDLASPNIERTLISFCKKWKNSY